LFQYDESLNYFGLHVEDAWKKGYNGSGITIAVTDIGVSADIVDLRKNLVNQMLLLIDSFQPFSKNVIKLCFLLRWFNLKPFFIF
jgi:subtilisin family serine protease